MTKRRSTSSFSGRPAGALFKAYTVFWLISLLMPSTRRQDGDQPFDNFSHLIRSPETRGLLIKIVAMIVAAAVIWFLLAEILSFLNVWMLIGLVAVMAGSLIALDLPARRRERWIQQGCCAQCGYDLRGSPERCPECGRDPRLDEAIFRRVRRELEAKLLVEAEKVETQNPLPQETPMPVVEIPAVRVVTKNPQVDDAPIPME